MNLLTIVKKLSILSASLAFVVVFVIGVSNSTPLDVLMLRCIIVFIAVLLLGLFIYGLAVQDRATGEDVSGAAGVGGSVSGVEDIENIEDIEDLDS